MSTSQRNLAVSLAGLLLAGNMDGWITLSQADECTSEVINRSIDLFACFRAR